MARTPDLDAYRRDVQEHVAAPGPAADERLAHLFELEAVEGLAAAAEEAPPAVARRLRALARFAAEGHLRLAAAAEQGALAEEARDATAEVDGDELTLPELGARIAAEPDAAVRRSLQAARLRLIESRLLPHLDDARERAETAAAAAGAPSPEEFVARAAGLDLAALAAAAASFLEATDEPHARLLDRALREAVGHGLGEAGAADLPRLAAAPHAGPGLAPERAAEAVAHTLELLGVDPGRLPAPPRPEGPGLTGMAGVLRAAGGSLPVAAASPRLPVEDRLLGDPALARAHAHLWEGLLAEPAWLARVLRLDDPEAPARAAAALRLLAARLAAARLVEGAGGGEELSRAAGMPWPGAFRASDRAGPVLGAADDLRGWSLGAALRARLREDMGPRWFAEARAGALLTELWAEGVGLDPEGLARDLGAPGLDPRLLAAEAEEALASVP